MGQGIKHYVLYQQPAPSSPRSPGLDLTGRGISFRENKLPNVVPIMGPKPQPKLKPSPFGIPAAPLPYQTPALESETEPFGHTVRPRPALSICLAASMQMPTSEPVPMMISSGSLHSMTSEPLPGSFLSARRGTSGKRDRDGGTDAAGKDQANTCQMHAEAP